MPQEFVGDAHTLVVPAAQPPFAGHLLLSGVCAVQVSHIPPALQSCVPVSVIPQEFAGEVQVRYAPGTQISELFVEPLFSLGHLLSSGVIALQVPHKPFSLQFSIPVSVIPQEFGDELQVCVSPAEQLLPEERATHMFPLCT